MRPGLFALAMVAAIAVPTVAQAGTNGVRVEARIGPVWSKGHARGQVGFAVGIDKPVAGPIFVGVEGDLDKTLARGARFAFGVSGRAGIDVPLFAKVYAVSGYSTRNYRGGEGAWNAGLGLQRDLLPETYAKLEYRHYFAAQRTAKGDGLFVGVGLHF